MLRSKLKIILIAVASLFVFLILTGGCLFIYGFPKHPINIALFKLTYNLTPAKKTFLELYSPARRDINAGYVPVEINQFLLQKLETTDDENEISAIAHFYAIQANGYRLGYIYDVSDRIKPQIINQLIKELDNDSNLIGTIILIEEIRRGERLGKGSIGPEPAKMPISSTPPTLEEIEKWKIEQLRMIAKPKYWEWWNSNLSWEEKKKINPLQNTEIRVEYCCG